MEQHLHQQKWQVKSANRPSFSTTTWHINAQAEQQLCERVCSAFTGTSQPAPHTLPCLSTFHLLLLAVWYGHSAHTQVPGSQLSPCLSSHRHSDLAFSLFPPRRNKFEMPRQTSDTKTGLVKQTKQKPSLALAYLIWFIKQACESEVLVSSTHVHHCFLLSAKPSCPNMLTGSMPSSTVHAVSSEAWATQEIALTQQAPSSQLSSELAVHHFHSDFALAFSATFYPTPHQLLLPQHHLIYGTLQIVPSCHFHNVFPVSDNALIKQFFVKPTY